MKKVLVIDDNEDNAYIIKEVLDLEGYVSKTLTDSQMIYDMVMNFKPDLILIDVSIGYDVKKLCSDLGRSKDYSHIKFILLSTAPNLSEDEASISTFDDFIAKPFDINLLIEKVKNILA